MSETHLQATVGADRSNPGDGSSGAVRRGKEGGTLSSDITARYQQAVLGGNVYGSFVWTHAETNNAVIPDTDSIGFNFGGGHYFTEDWEAFGRYEWSDLDYGGLDSFGIITAGVNRYFAGHNAKWTTDIGFATDSLAFEIPVTGFKGDGVGKNGQWVIRSQLQIVF